jgi:hypothetical protein
MITAREATAGTRILLPLVGLGGYITVTVVRWEPAGGGYAHLIARREGHSAAGQQGQYTADETFRLAP